MSRPTKKEPRDRQLNLSLTVSEWDRIRRRAEALGMRPAYFARAAVLATKDSDRPNAGKEERDEQAPLLRLLYNQLIRVGSNLNQMMRHLHQTGDPLPADLLPLLKDIRALLDQVTQ